MKEYAEPHSETVRVTGSSARDFLGTVTLLDSDGDGKDHAV